MPYEDMSATITRPTANSYHALLFVGVCNVMRYYISLNRWTSLLHEMYGYPLANIRIVVGPHAFGAMPAGTTVTLNATLNDLDTTLENYGAGGLHPLGPTDKLFIFTFNHGGNDGLGAGSYLCCDNFSTQYLASDFANRIAAIGCEQIVLLAAQCNAGGFVDPFINALQPNTRGAVMAGCRSDQVTYEAICDKLYASAFNGRMVQDAALDDNIDLSITSNGMSVYGVPGFNTNRIDWGSTGVLSTREAFNWVYDHYINFVRPAYPAVTEIPLYRQKPWLTAQGQPVDIRLGEADLIMQDNPADTGVEPSGGSPWHSPDIRPDNSDQFVTGPFEYVPAHDNRFFLRTANRGTAPTDDVWRYVEVRGLGFTGGPVGPPRLDRAMETAGAVTVSARLRPGRAHTQFDRILIGGNFGHGCVSAATWCGTDPMSHPLWNLVDNDQVQCNLDPAPVSGTQSADSSSVNSNAGKVVRVIPVFADEAGTFQLRVGEARADFKVKTAVKPKSLALKAGGTGTFELEIMLAEKVDDGARGEITAELYRGRDRIGGVTFQLKTATAAAEVAVYTHEGRPVSGADVTLTHPGDSRTLTARTDEQGHARFGPLNPGFYFASTKGANPEAERLQVSPGRENSVRLFVSERKREVKEPRRRPKARPGRGLVNGRTARPRRGRSG